MSNLPGENQLGKVAFTVGVLGNMDIAESPELVAKVKGALRFLLEGGKSAGFPHENLGLGDWSGLGGTEIVVLCNLAPGADTIGAQAVEELKAEGLPFRLRCPLPFPAEDYVDASTFSKDEEKDRFRKIVGSLPPEDVFPVLLREHPITKEKENNLPWWDEAARQRWRADLHASLEDGTKIRHLRYRAAAEYVAAYCDVLIALWDDREEAEKPTDTARAVNSKRRGLEETLLPLTSGFTWADNGPVWHLAVTRTKFSADGTLTHPHAGEWRILHPHELDPGPIPRHLAEGGKLPAPEPRPEHFLKHFSYRREPDEALHERLAAWMEQGNAAFVTAGWNLRNFTELARGVGPGAKLDLGGWRKNLAADSKREAEGWGVDGEEHRYARPRAAMARARRVAADMAGALDTRRNDALKLLFHCAFLSALMIHAFTHYHPHPDPGHHVAWPALVQVGLLVGAIAIAATSLNRFARYSSTRGEARRYDARALAEGLRVQLAWALAGIHRSAAANYMQHQRGELAWVRSAMSSLAVPYHQWLESWVAASTAQKLARLQQVKNKWVVEQSNYFFKSQKKRDAAMHFWHTLGKLMALAGAVLFLVSAVLLFSGEPFEVCWIKKVLVGMGVVAVCGIAARFVQHWRAIREGWQGIDDDHPSRDDHRPKDMIPWKGVRKDGAASLEYVLVHRLLAPLPLPGHHPHAGHHQRPVLDEEELIARGRRAFRDLLFFACWPALVLFLIASWLFPWHELKDTCIIFAGSSSVAGALMVAWAEKQLYSEEAYHFNSMAIIFRAAEERLACLLKQAGESADSAVQDKAIKEAQELLLALGKEALNENAEWLILHRSRPMEPVLGA